MDISTILKKTEKGIDEINTRKYKLDSSLRRILILVDGKSDVAKILEKGKGLPAISESLAELERNGYIVPHSGGLKNKLITIVKETLGKDADKVISKIETAPDTKEAMEEVLNNCKKIVKLMIDEKKAEELIRKCNELFR